MVNRSLVKELCEFLGVTILGFTVLSLGSLTPIAPITGSFLAGAIVMIIIYGVGTISGAHINPAVSFGFLCSGRFPLAQFWRYLAVQLLGSIAALGLIRAIAGAAVDWSQLTPQIPSPAAFGVEAGLTGLLIFVIFSVATYDCRICPDARPIAGVVIGVAIIALSFYGGALGVGVLNPAVLLIPTLMTGSWLSFLLFVVAEVIGAIAGAMLYRFTRVS